MTDNIGADEGLGYAVVNAVSDFEDCDPTELAPLQNLFDIESLEKLFSSETDAEIRVSFQYSNSNVSVEQGCLSISSDKVGNKRRTTVKF